MHNQIMESSEMDQDANLVQDSNAYGHETWVDLNMYPHSTTMADYGHDFGGYIPPISTGLPSESLGRMPPPPSASVLAQSPVTHAQLPMLMASTHTTWPSMLTHPHGYGAHSAPPMVTPPAVAPPLKTARLPAIQTTSQPRKTLTDDDRRRMCEYAESHPQAKQTDIGSIFGVERSTVSKVLRNKEKFLYLEDRSNSPIKRFKGKVTGADIEKALANFVRNAQKSGATVTKDELQEKARLFSSTMTGSSTENFLRANNAVWLEKFMQKNGIGGAGKLLRRASETNIPDAMRSSPSLTSSQPSSAMSPTSPGVHPSQSPLSAHRSDEDKDVPLNSAFTDSASASFSASSGMSPTGPFNFSPNPDMGGFRGGDQDNSSSGLGPDFQRPRSQTFPTLDLEYLDQPQTSTGEAEAGADPLTPKYHVSSMSSTTPSSALESPDTELSAPFGLAQTLASPQQHHSKLRRSTSTSSLAGRSAATAGSSPVSPSHEDARRAADTLLSFIQCAGGFVDQNEYMAVVRLTEKLRIHQTQMAKAAAGGMGAMGGAMGGGMGGLGGGMVGLSGMGGLSQIPEGDSEMTNAPLGPLQVEPMGS